MSTTAVQVRANSDLAIADGQTFWSEKQVAALKQMGVSDASNGDLAVFFHQSVRTGLDPFLRQIHMIGRNSKNQRTQQWETKYTIQTGIDGYRLIARRVVDAAGETLGYEDTQWCGPDGQWVDVWLSDEPPAAARVVVLRNGERFSAIALWREYVQTVKDKATGEFVPNSMWSRMASGQLAKCAEALALRKAFPQDLSGIYTDEEMAQADRHQPEQPAPGGQRSRGGVSRLRSVVSEPKAEEPVDAEIVEEPADTRASRAQIARIHELLADQGIGDREAGLAYISGQVGRDVTHTNELTAEDADVVLAALDALAAPDDVDPETGEVRS